MKVAVSSALLLAAVAAAGSSAYAQSYPARPIRLIVPFAPGGTTDILARMIGQKLASSLGQQVVVDNRSGAGGIIGSELAARAAPDGYTLAIGHVGTLAINVSLQPKLPYDPVRDFAPVTLVAIMPNALVVSNNVAAKSVKEFIALARSRPEEVMYGSAGNGSTTHLGMVYLSMLAHVKLTHVPYKGAGPAIADLIAGNISAMVPGILPVMTHVKTGKLRLLAVTTHNRLAIFPEIPTIAESGVPGYEFTNWIAVVGPAAMPRPIVSRLNAEIATALAQPDLKERLALEGGEATASSPSELGARIKAEIARWAPVVKASGAR
jgi:tripartite-type tricarboxylate transporter receptor subunit TctC